MNHWFFLAALATVALAGCDRGSEQVPENSATTPQRWPTGLTPGPRTSPLVPGTSERLPEPSEAVPATAPE